MGAVDRATYAALLDESEYAAWVAAFGFRVNHFTVDVNRLTTIADLAELNALLRAAGFTLNEAGGAIKGTPADRLEQSSTRADEVDVAFAEGVARVPSCYYEFARRYPLPSGERRRRSRVRADPGEPAVRVDRREAPSRAQRRQFQGPDEIGTNVLDGADRSTGG